LSSCGAGIENENMQKSAEYALFYTFMQYMQKIVKNIQKSL
jgi:hypothetical protein